MTAECDESTVIQLSGRRIEYLIASWILKIDLTGIGTWIIHITVKSIAWQTINRSHCRRIILRIWNAHTSWMYWPH
jgi:hypothetical protein